MRYTDIFPTSDLADYDGRGASKRLKAGHVCRYRCSEREYCSIHAISTLNRVPEQFIRLLGGTLSLAIGATIINNCLRARMTSLNLASSTISQIVDDPTILGARTSASDTSLADLGISADVAQNILDSYIKGFRTVFILNASLNAVATIAAITMIRHIELTRGDEEMLKQKAIEEAQASEKNSVTEAAGVVAPQEKEKTPAEENV